MLEDTPIWRYRPRHSMTLDYGHVCLLPEHVLGQWFCLERKTGKALWDHPISPANSVLGVSEGVIVATGASPGDAWGRSLGAFGISLQAGEILWTSLYWEPDRKSLRGKFLRLLDRLVPARYEDHAVGVRNAECITARGRVLDIHTGKEMRREPKTEDWPAFWKDASPGKTLYERKPVDCGHGRILRHGSAEHPAKEGSFPDGTFELFLSDRSGNPVWSFDLAASGHFIDGNYFSYRYLYNYVYMIVSERPQRVPVDPSKPNALRDNPAQYFLWVLDIDTGGICQKIRLNGGAVTSCRLEDVDDRGVLASCGGSVILYSKRPKMRP